ncbi:hypothetical protein ACGFNP_02745 [Nonomuraea sp. NPDC049269]|uniref:hypothetical protein n=1 Tax=Nonomuraea sp. NPDC049269 TaxID=3364349 RepID=UPI003718DD2B
MDPGLSDSRAVLSKLIEVRQALAGSRVAVDRQVRTKRLKAMDALLVAACTTYDQDKDAFTFGDFLSQWLEISPITSAELAGVALTVEDGDALGAGWERVFGAYLLALLDRWPAMSLTDNRVRDRILAGLRRCAVTVRPCADGVVRLRALTRQDLYQDTALPVLTRRVVQLLLGGGNGPGLTLYRYVLPLYGLPAAYANVSRDIEGEGYTTDLSFVPAHERDAVQYAILRTTQMMLKGAPLDLRGAVWPLTIPVPGGYARYELITDHDGRVRAERLGDGVDRPLPAWLSRARTVDERKASLKQTFQLGGVGDRPPGAKRAEKKWTAAELGQVASVLDRIPAGDRGALTGTSLIRDFALTSDEVASFHGGMTHVGMGGDDLDGPPTEPTPHLHCYDVIFEQMARMACGPPGDSGSGGDATVLHEIGHVVTMCPHEQAVRELARLRDKPRTAYEQLDMYLRSQPTTNAFVAAFTAWTLAYGAYTAANDAFSEAAHACWQAFRTDVPGNAEALLSHYAEAQKTAVATAEPTMTAARGLDALLPAQERKVVLVTEVLLSRHTLIPGLAAPGFRLARFAAYARRVGFVPFTAYGQSSNKEFFAETYALYTTDRERLWQLNWRMCAWMEDGYPALGSYEPTVR